MTMYQQLIYPLLAQTDAETIHERTLQALAWAQKNGVGRAMLRAIAGNLSSQPISLFGLTFPNVLGMAAGFDKDVRVASGLAQLGFGHIEVGTLTPRPQVGNPRPRIFRLAQDGALINRMGFPNGGVAAAVPRLQTLSHSPHSFILGVSLGKQKETPLADADQDYIAVMQTVYSHADYLAVNISSPNTPSLRELQGGDYLGHLLGQLMAENKRLAQAHQCAPRPLLVKIAPDLTWPELDTILEAVQAHHIHGVIATNTTIDRAGLTSQHREETGGLSGLPLQERSLEVVQYVVDNAGIPVIGVGGIRTADDVQAYLDVGASLVQLYTALIYEGPRLPGQLVRQIATKTSKGKRRNA